jgi:regulator of sigma E protease
MANTAKPQTRVLSGVFWLAILVAVIYLIVRNLGVVSNVVIVLLGFGAVVLVHEFGHFIVAKLSGIHVEAFSIFMPPTLLGIRKTRSGFKVCLLPALSNREAAGNGKGGDSDAPPAEETEYRVGVFPFGGYVKLLGQEDTGPVKQIDDPRSFANKPISSRIAVISAGVLFNVISAALIFMVVFLIGIELAPAMVGGVVPGSPAAEAGLVPGDTFLDIDGDRKDLNFSNILIAAALSDKGEPVPMVVRHPDGSIEKKTLVAKVLPGSSLREFGILQPLSLTVAEVARPDVRLLRERTGLRPGDRIVAVDGAEVKHYWDFEKAVTETLAPTIKVTAERSAAGGPERVSTDLPLSWEAAKSGDVKTDADLNQVYSMVPRLRIAALEKGLADSKTPAAGTGETQGLKVGDIVVGAADIEYPTYRELRDTTVAYERKPLPLRVLRADANGVEREMTVTVTPKPDKETGRVVIGFAPALDAKHAVVADTIAVAGGPAKLDIPRGARIVSVNDTPVSSFYDVIQQVRHWENRPVMLRYQVPGGPEGGVVLPAPHGPPVVESSLAEPLPVAPLEQLYLATGPLNAISMGYRQTVVFIEQTYVTLKQLLSGLLSPKLLMGPVGIITFSYRIVAEQPLINYAYFLGLISATIAVLNFLPIPPFDGGLVVLMIVEKIRGVALSERAQGIVAYAGWAMVLVLLVYVTFNDIVRTFFSGGG